MAEVTDPRAVIALAGAVGAAVGAVLAALIGLLGVYLNKRSDEPRHFRELVVNAAVAHYQADREFARAYMSARPQGPMKLYPFDDYVVHMGLLADIVLRSERHPDELISQLQQLGETQRRLMQLRDEEQKADAGR